MSCGVSIKLDVLVDKYFSFFIKTYRITSMAQTRMARTSWMIRTLFSVPTKQIVNDFFLFYHEIVCCMYSLESPHRL